MGIQKFEDIISWKKSNDLALLIYKLFKENNDFGFKNQIQRAVISISNNIAEGFERKSNKEFIYFLYIAKGSCAEVRSMIYVAKELEYISKKEFNNLYIRLVEISKLLLGFIKSLR